LPSRDYQFFSCILLDDFVKTIDRLIVLALISESDPFIKPNSAIRILFDRYVICLDGFFVLILLKKDNRLFESKDRKSMDLAAWHYQMRLVLHHIYQGILDKTLVNPWRCVGWI
jgi:hypothetical protein